MTDHDTPATDPRTGHLTGEAIAAAFGVPRELVVPHVPTFASYPTAADLERRDAQSPDLDPLSVPDPAPALRATLEQRRAAIREHAAAVTEGGSPVVVAHADLDASAAAALGQAVATMAEREAVAADLLERAAAVVESHALLTQTVAELDRGLSVLASEARYYVRSPGARRAMLDTIDTLRLTLAAQDALVQALNPGRSA